MAKPPKPLKSISTTVLGRTFAIGRMSVQALAKSAIDYTSNRLSGMQGEDLKQKIFSEQAALLAKELGKLKGSLMKAGQMLSVYGEHFFPPEVNRYLRLLQKDSPPVSWKVIEKALKRSLTPETLAKIAVDPAPYAAASIGQVHRGKILTSGEDVCVKVQYPGVDKVIDSDLKTLRGIFSVLRFLPKGEHLDPVFEEIRSMLKREVDYEKELEATETYREFVGDDPRFQIPKTYPEFSSKRVITTSFEEGFSLESAEVQTLSQERRNALGYAALELFLREFFAWGFVQTDPHFGNYRIRIVSESSTQKDQDKIVLLDFGAMRKFPKSFLQPYYDMVWGTFLEDQERFADACRRLGLLQPDSPAQIHAALYELAQLVMEPFRQVPLDDASKQFFGAGATYDWGRTDLPDRVAKKLKEFLFMRGVSPPPREFVFLDRKLAGVFIFLRQLGTVISSHECLLRFK